MMLAEAMVRPGSRIIGQTLEFTNLPARSHCTVLGIQRRARMLRTRLGELRLEPGDVLLLLGLSDDIERLRGDPDILVMEWSASEMPLVRKAPLAAADLRRDGRSGGARSGADRGHGAARRARPDR